MNTKDFEKTKAIKLTFMKIGIRCDMRGFNYFCDAVEFAVDNVELLNHLCDGLYKKVGMKNHVKNIDTVERCMRHALEDCFEKRTYSRVDNTFKNNFLNIDKQPTVGELIRIVTENYMQGQLSFNK